MLKFKLFIVTTILSYGISMAQPTPCASVASSSACADLPTFQFNNCTVGAVSCFWDFGDGFATNNTCNSTIFANYLVAGPGTYQVVLTVCDGPSLTGNCDTAIINIIVYELPTAGFSVNDQEGCTPFNVCFTDQSIIGDAPISNWLYTYGDGGFSAGSADPCYTYPTTSLGTWDIILQVVDDNGCSDTSVQSQYITVQSTPVADFTISPNLGGFPSMVACNPGEVITFTDNSTQADTVISQWTWDFGDGNTGTGNTASNTYMSSGQFDVTLYITDANGCQDSVTKIIRVDNFKAQAGFTMVNSVGCGTQIVTFLDTTSSFQAPNSWLWDFNYDGPGTFTIESTTGPNVGHYYATPGNRCVALVVTNVFGCTDTIINCTGVMIYTPPAAGFTVDTVVACDFPFAVTFTNTTGGATSWIWDIDNGFPPPSTLYDWSVDYSSSSFTHNYMDIGCFNVSLIVTDTNGCSDSLVMDELVCVTKPNANFFADIIMDTSNLVLPFIAKGCVPLRVNFADLSTFDTALIDDSIVTWFWDFGDGYTIEGPGPNSIMPDSTNNCLTSCTYNNPTHIYVDTGSFVVTLAIQTSRGCTDTITMDQTSYCTFLLGPCSVDAGIPPVASFTANDTVGVLPFTVQFSGLSSSYANEWAWDFGDGATSIVQNPPYTYDDLGYFDVSLTAKFNGCASNTNIITDYINVEGSNSQFATATWKDNAWSPENHFCYGDSMPNGGWKIRIRDTSGGTSVWIWDLGDTNTIKAVDTMITLSYDTIISPAVSVMYPSDTVQFIAGDTSICSTSYMIIIAGDTVMVPADTIIPGATSVTLNITGDVMHYLGMSTGTSVVNPAATVVIYTYTVIPQPDTINDTTFMIYMQEQYDTTLQSTTVLGCNTVVDILFSVMTTSSNIISTMYGLDTVSYAPYDSVGISTLQALVQPDSVVIISGNSLVVISPNMISVGQDTFNIFWDVILTDSIVFNVSADLNTYNIDYVFVDTIFPDTTFIPAETIFSGYCETIFMEADTLISPPDPIFGYTLAKAHEFKYTYLTPGTKTIMLYTVSKCSTCEDTLSIDSVAQEIYISKVDADFTINAPFGGDTSNCVVGSFFFQDITTTIYNTYERTWDFGDGFILVSPPFPFVNNPIPSFTHPTSCAPGGSSAGSYEQVNHVYCIPGTYDVKMITTDQFGCKDSVVHQVVVHANPLPVMIPDTLTGCVNDLIKDDLQVIFSDTVLTHSAQIKEWIWLYGDGAPNDTTEIPVSPSHQYTACGTYAPILYVLDEFECTNASPAFSVPILITCPNAILSTPNSVCSGSPMTFYGGASGGNPITYYWDWCDGSNVDTTTLTFATHVFNVDTTTDFRVTLTVLDANGCRDTASVVVTIEQPVADFYYQIADIDTLCPNIFKFIDESSLDVELWQWNFGDNSTTITSDTSVTHSYYPPGTYNLSLVTIGGAPSFCKDSIFKPNYIVVKGPLLMDTSVVDSGTCAPLKVTFTIITYNTDIVTIFFGDGDNAKVNLNANILFPDTDTTVITHYYLQGGSFQPIIQLEDPADSTGLRCPYQFPLSIVTVIGPELNFFASDTISPPGLISFFNTSVNAGGVGLWEWNFGDGSSILGLGTIPVGTNNGLTSGTYTDPIHDYLDTGYYDIMLAGYVIGVDSCRYEITELLYIHITDSNTYVVENDLEVGIKIYPNPLTSLAYFINLPNDSKFSISVYNLLGEQVLDQKNVDSSIDLSFLEDGIYLVKIQLPSSVIARKIVKYTK